MSWPQAQEHKSIPYTGLSLLQSFHWMRSKALSIPTAASPHPSIRPFSRVRSTKTSWLPQSKSRPQSLSCPVSNSWGIANINPGNLGCSHIWGLFRTFLARRKPLQPMTPSITLNSSGSRGKTKISQGKRSLNSRSCRQTHHPPFLAFLL